MLQERGAVMPESAGPSEKAVAAIAGVVGLELPPDRLATLVQTLSDFLAGFERVRVLDLAAYEPPVLTFEAEAETQAQAGAEGGR